MAIKSNFKYNAKCIFNIRYNMYERLYLENIFNNVFLMP